MMSYALGKIDKNKSYFTGKIRTANRLEDFFEDVPLLNTLCLSNQYHACENVSEELEYLNEHLSKKNLHLLGFDYLRDADHYYDEVNGFRFTSYKFNSKAKTQAVKLMKQIILEQPRDKHFGWDGKNFFFSKDKNDFIFTIIYAKEINEYIKQGKFAPITITIYKHLAHFYEWSKDNEYEDMELVRLAEYIYLHMNSDKSTDNDVLIKENGEFKIVPKATVETFLLNTQSLIYCASHSLITELDKQYVFLSSCRRLIPNF